MSGGNHKWWVLSVAAAGVLLATIDASIVNIALPTIGEHFGTSVQNTAWVTISYLLVITAFLLVFGRLSDLYGQKLIFTGGLLIFTIGSGLCAVSQSITQLVFFRSVQGIGAAMIMSNTTAIVTNVFPPNQRGKGLGTIGAVVSIGLMLGPPLGGFIIHYLGWNYIFLVNVPVGIAAVALTLKILPENRADKGSSLFHPIDSVLWVAGITVFILGFRASGGSSSIAGYLILYEGISILLLGMFFVRQVNSNSPLMKPSLLKNDIFLFASIAAFFSFMAMISLTFMLPFLLEYAFHKTPLDTGTVLIVIPATTAVISPLSGHLSDKFGQRPIAGAGTLISTLAIASMFLIRADFPIWAIATLLAFFGLGLGMFGSPNNSAMMGSVDIRDRGSAGGILATVRNLGMASGLGVISLIYNSGVKESGTPDFMAYLGAFKGSLPVVIGFSLVALIFSLLRKSVNLGNK
jgi:EmrB/QacA subfamily drug resistance transporter